MVRYMPVPFMAKTVNPLKSFTLIALLVLFGLTVPAVQTAPAQELPPGQELSLTPDPAAEVTPEDMQNLVDLLQDAERRDAFIKHLQTLIELQKKQQKNGAGVPLADTEQTIEAISTQMDSFSEQIADTLKRTIQVVHQIPLFLSEIGQFLQNPDNLIDLIILLSTTLIAILAGLSAARVIRRYLPSLTDHPHHKPGLILLGLVQASMNMLPYAVTLVVLHLFFRIMPMLPQGQDFILLLVWVFCIYKVSVLVLGYLLSPTQARIRILPVKDHTAVFLHRWMGYFAKFTGIYYIISQGVLTHVVDRILFFMLYHGLRAIFPIILSIFVLRLASLIRQDRQGLETKGPEKEALWLKLRSLAIRFWHMPTVLYIWVVFLFSVGGYQTEFSYLLSITVGTLVIVLGVILGLVGVDYAFGWLVDAEQPSEPKYIRFARLFFKIMLVMLGFFIMAYVWGIPLAGMITSRYGTLLLARFLVIALTVGLLMLVMASSQAAAKWFLEEKDGVALSRKRRTLVPIINATIKGGAMFVALIVILDRLGVNVAPILAGAGIIGLGVGLGAQSLVKDLINGLFILFQDMIAVGDWAQLGDKSGEVESISLRAVRIRDLSGNVHIIPNSAIDTVTNMSKNFSRYVFDVGVAYRENVDEVMKVLEEIGADLQNDPKFAVNILHPLEIFGVNEFADSAVIIRGRITTRPLKQWEIGREFNRRMKNVFDERGIEIPFPHQTIYMGEPKTGSAPPLNVRVQGTPKAGRGGGPEASVTEQAPEMEAPPEPKAEKNRG